MKKASALIIISLLLIFSHSSEGLAGGIPLTTNDVLTTAINSNNSPLDVLSNDNSGISNDNFKEVVAVCAIGTSDLDCTNNSYTDGIGTVSVNVSGNDNNVLFASNHNQTHTFEFKYLMQNSANNQSSGTVVLNLAYFEVNSLSDGAENGCDASDCTLREALSAAVNDNQASLINFKRDMNGTIELNNGLVINSNDLTVVGTGADRITVSGNDLFRVLSIPTGTERFSLSGLTIANGQTPNQGNGGGILIESALETRLENIRVINNVAENNGGGIFTDNAGLVLINSEISNNTASNKGGGIAVSGGFGSDVTIENTTISNNQATDAATSGLEINTTFGQTTTLRFITVAFNQGFNGVDSSIDGTGNIIIDASVFEPGLAITNSNNVTNNSIFQNLGDGSIFGDNNLTELGSILNQSLVEINDSGLYGHKFGTDDLPYNHVDDMFGTASCGNQVTTDQFGTPRPIDQSCDAGAYEYIFIDVIFQSGFE
jgi:CSLREA domain-containing protein